MLIAPRRLAAAAAAVLSVPLLIGSTAHAATPSPTSTGAALTGYQRVTSAELTDHAGTQTMGSVTCPAGTKIVGGGALIHSSGLSENLNSSYPGSVNATWYVYVNNASTVAGTFVVYADCARKLVKYKVVESTGVDNPAGDQTIATVSCPSGTVALGGGSGNASSSNAVLLNSSLPNGNTGWRADINNNGGLDDTVEAYAICAKEPAGYKVVAGPGTDVGAGTQGSSDAACPSGTDVLGGGALSSSGSVTVDLNSIYPVSATSWRAYEDGTATTASTVTAYAVCARA